MKIFGLSIIPVSIALKVCNFCEVKRQEPIDISKENHSLSKQNMALLVYVCKYKGKAFAIKCIISLNQKRS